VYGMHGQISYMLTLTSPVLVYIKGSIV